MVNFIDYSPEAVKVTNLDALPKGTGCKYLLVIESPYFGEYVAKQWLRKMPSTTKRCEAVIRF